MATSRAPIPSRTVRLCYRCRGLELLGTDDFRALDFEDDWPALSGLKLSAAAGCDFCSMVCANVNPGHEFLHIEHGSSQVRIIIRPDWPGRNGKLYALRVHLFSATTEVAEFLRPRLDDPSKRMPNFSVCSSFMLCIQGDTQSSMATVRMLSAPTIRVLSERNVTFLQKSLADSAESGETTALCLPTRLLDLAELEWGRARLVVTARISHSEYIKYAALSYCWGNPNTAKLQSITTFSNLEDRKASFEIKGLSPVIQDAIEVCSSLSIRYLWVDALCILQAGTLSYGSPGQEAAKADWEFESQHLWETFRGAYITICAASSTSCQDSFLQDRQIHQGLVIRLRTQEGAHSSARSINPRESSACKIIPWPTNGIEDEMQLSSRDRTPFLETILNSRWYSRGWVHQEISFSKRLLIFDTHMLYFKCGKLQAHENGWRDERCETSWRLREIDLETLQTFPFRSFATDVAVLYAKDFTVETDRLPAIAALASQVASLTKSQYLAGLWRDNLANDLVFSIAAYLRKTPLEERLRELSDAQTNARPSWSWAGHRGSFKHLGGNRNALWLNQRDSMTLDCAVLEAVAEPQGQSPFGAVSHAHLILRCRMVGVRELLRDKVPPIQPSEVLTDAFLFFEGFRICWDTDNEAAPASLAENISFICTSVDGENEVAGLVVLPAEGGKYYRIGMWELSPWKQVGSSCFDNHHEWKSHTIVLV